MVIVPREYNIMYSLNLKVTRSSHVTNRKTPPPRPQFGRGLHDLVSWSLNRKYNRSVVTPPSDGQVYKDLYVSLGPQDSAPKSSSSPHSLLFSRQRVPLEKTPPTSDLRKLLISSPSGSRGLPCTHVVQRELPPPAPLGCPPRHWNLLPSSAKRSPLPCLPLHLLLPLAYLSHFLSKSRNICFASSPTASFFVTQESSCSSKPCHRMRYLKTPLLRVGFLSSTSWK